MILVCSTSRWYGQVGASDHFGAVALCAQQSCLDLSGGVMFAVSFCQCLIACQQGLVQLHIPGRFECISKTPEVFMTWRIIKTAVRFMAPSTSVASWQVVNGCIEHGGDQVGTGNAQAVGISSRCLVVTSAFRSVI